MILFKKENSYFQKWKTSSILFRADNFDCEHFITIANVVIESDSG